MPGWVIPIIIIVVLIGACVALYFTGKKQQKKNEEAEAQIQASKQSVNVLIIDKKYVKMNQAGLPDIAMAQVPRLMRGRKVPVVKAKVGPRIMTLLCDEKVYPYVPVKKEVKAEVSGLYLVGVKAIHGPSLVPDEKLTMRARLSKKLAKTTEAVKADNDKKSKKK